MQRKPTDKPDGKPKELDDRELDEVSGGVERLKGGEEQRPSEPREPTAVDHRLG